MITIDFNKVPTLDPDAIVEKCRQSPSALENWIKVIEDKGIRTPKTTLIPLATSLQMEMMDGFPLSDESKDQIKILSQQIQKLGDEMGFPLFIRTSFTSAKHYWKESCCLYDCSPDNLEKHIEELVMYQSLSPNFLTPSIVVREMIDVDPMFTAFSGQMPVTKEFRVFADSGKVLGYQPYWPEEAIEDPSIDGWEEKLISISKPSEDQISEMIQSAQAVTKQIGGYWSVDFLVDRDDKLWLIDMAEGGKSYKNEKEFVSLNNKSSSKHDVEYSP